MPLNHNLNTKYTDLQITNLQTAIADILAIINATVAEPLNLSDDERQGTRTVGDIRYPYAQRAVNDFGSIFTSLNGPIPVLTAFNNLTFYEQNRSLELGLNELLDWVIDLKINSGYIAMKFTDDQYDNATKYKSRNVPGADTVYDAQKELYDRESTPTVGGNPTP